MPPPGPLVEGLVFGQQHARVLCAGFFARGLQQRVGGRVVVGLQFQKLHLAVPGQVQPVPAPAGDHGQPAAVQLGHHFVHGGLGQGDLPGLAARAAFHPLAHRQAVKLRLGQQVGAHRHRQHPCGQQIVEPQRFHRLCLFGVPGGCHRKRSAAFGKRAQAAAQQARQQRLQRHAVGGRRPAKPHAPVVHIPHRHRSQHGLHRPVARLHQQGVVQPGHVLQPTGRIRPAAAVPCAAQFYQRRQVFRRRHAQHGHLPFPLPTFYRISRKYASISSLICSTVRIVLPCGPSAVQSMRFQPSALAQYSAAARLRAR